jgi:hypothetical protein
MMASTSNIDGVLVQWGDRLFYPGNREVRPKPQPRLFAKALQRRAATIRRRIEATVVRRAPQVMVKVTGGGRGMNAITAHFRYISKNGRLEMEDERGDSMRGRDAVHALAEDWRFGGGLIDEVCQLRHPLVDCWTQKAQRGGSRLLDPLGEYAPHYSEKWKLSINVASLMPGSEDA